MRFAVVTTCAALMLAFGVASATEDTQPHIDTSGVNLQPAYPASAYGTRESGAVVLGVGVTSEGKVSRIRLVQTSGFNDIDSTAIAGVMGWKFIPATHDRTAVEGVSVVKLVFQPPPDAAAQGNPTAAPEVKSPTNFLPSTIDLQAERSKFAYETRPIPCPNGKVTVTLQFQHVLGEAAFPYEAQGMAFMAVEVLSDHDAAAVVMEDAEAASPPVEDFLFRRTSADGQQQSKDLEFRGFGNFGTKESVSISWNAYGLVTGTVGNLQTQQTQLPSQPTKIRLTVSSLAARFIAPELVCVPSASE